MLRPSSPSPRAQRQRAFRHGLISLVLGSALGLGLLLHSEQAHRRGDLQTARESLLMLWSPGVFALAGVLFLLRSIGPPYGQSSRGSRPRWGEPPDPSPTPGSARRSSAVPSSASARAAATPASADAGAAAADTAGQDPATAAATDRYRQACLELGVSPGADWVVIRATWRRRLQEWHPDRGGDPEQWIRKKAAYNLLEAWEQFRT